MNDRPTGTVTFLFTDVEGSTRLWEEHPEGMRDALALHESLLEQQIGEAGGFVHSTAGDAYSAAFSDPLDAIGAAIAAQRSLADAEWPVVGEMRVRMAAHTGVAHERGDDYYGPALNRCARIFSAAHGGQIVTSRGTEELVRHRMHPGSSLRDLGEHQLKDLGHPEHIFQVVAPGLDTEFAELRSLDPTKNNLPLQLTSFVGREDELRDVKKRLLDTRLLTLTGVGGSGKTRLSLQAAAESAENFKDGVWLVELAAVSDPDKLAPWVAESLRINRGQGGGVGGAAQAGETVPVIDQIVGFLQNRQTLLILDNCEHLIGASADRRARPLG
jgi:class 3 adenylate cyclase